MIANLTRAHIFDIYLKLGSTKKMMIFNKANYKNITKYWVVLAVLVISGCASAKNYDTMLTSWKGQSEKQLLAGWGPPDKIYTVSRKEKILTYKKTWERTQPSTCQTVTTGIGSVSTLSSAVPYAKSSNKRTTTRTTKTHTTKKHTTKKNTSKTRTTNKRSNNGSSAHSNKHSTKKTKKTNKTKNIKKTNKTKKTHTTKTRTTTRSVSPPVVRAPTISSTRSTTVCNPGGTVTYQCVTSFTLRRRIVTSWFRKGYCVQ